MTHRAGGLGSRGVAEHPEGTGRGDHDEADARADWQRRIYRRLTTTQGSDGALALPAPAAVRAEPGAGHIRLSWDAVPGAAGYLIERTARPAGEPRILTHGGSDVPAVVGPEFADTGLRDGVEYCYRIGAVASAGAPVWAWSEQVVAATTAAADPGPVAVRVDASTVVGALDRVWHMVGSERLSLLGEGVDRHGHDVGAEFAEALRRARDDLGVTRVRAHAILHDDNAVVSRTAEGTLGFSFDRVDRIYDRVLAMGVRPVVELSFMPAALARDPALTVFGYRGIISPPQDWSEWRELVQALAAHLVDRYGVDEVADWGFEVWNEPNLVVFWAGTQDEYLRLYDEAARAVKSVDPRLRIGGPATAAGEWVETLTAHAAQAGTPVDFVSTHTYGNLPLDLRPALHRHGHDGVPIWWTEWGVGSAHFGPIHDSVFGAAFVLSGFATVQGRLNALAYWVVSDHFEELGRPPRLFHDGFGLLSVGNLRKPRYWAVHLAAHLGDEVLASQVEGDGAQVLLQAWAARHVDGTVDVLLWNGCINTDLRGGDPRLDRQVTVEVTGLTPGTYRAELAQVDEHHSNVVAECPPDVEWPDAELWARLQERDRLDTEGLPDAAAPDGSAAFTLHLPMPGVARIRLSTDRRPSGTDEEKST